MNPIILYDNRFEDGALSATDTAAGFDVNNIKDLRAHTFWKANSYGTKYITEAPLAKGSLTKAETGLCLADGYAGAYLPSSLDLTPYIGDRIVINDSALKKAIGYIKSVGHKAVRTIGNSPITIPDNDNLDNPTNNFTISWEGNLDDWIYASTYDVFIFRKLSGSAGAYTGLFFSPLYNGKMRLTLYRNDSGTDFLSNTINTFADGTKHVLTCVVTRETAAEAGSVKFYVDKVQFGDSIAIPAAASVTLANTGNALLMYPVGGTAYKPMTNRNFTMWNYALSAAQVEDFVDNGVAAADQWGKQNESSGSVTFSNMRFSLLDGHAFVDFSAAGVLTDYIGRRITITDSAGKKAVGYIKAAGTGETCLGNAGNELFLSDISGWTAYTGGGGSIAWSGTSDVLFTQGGSSVWNHLNKALSTEVGATYHVKVVISSADTNVCKVIVGSTDWTNTSAYGGTTIYDSGTGGARTIEFEFVATATTTYIFLADGQAATKTSHWASCQVYQNLISNGMFSTDTTGWSVYAGRCSIASVAGGKVGNCLEITKVLDSTEYVYQNFTGTVNAFCLLSRYVKSGTSGNEASIAGFFTTNVGAALRTISANSTADWVESNTKWVIDRTGMSIGLAKNSSTAGTMLFDEVSLKQVITPAVTGVTIVSTPYGTTYNWKDIETGFNVNDTGGGYTYKIDKLGATLALEESGIDEIASLNGAALINSPALPYTTFSGASATGFHAESDGSGAHVAGTTDAIPFVSGRRYRVQFTLTLNSGTAPYYGAAVAFAGAAIGGASLFNEAVEGLNTYEFTCTGSDTGVIEFWNNSAPADYDISDFSVVYLGWKDSSTNGLDAAFPAGQYAVVLFNDIVSTPEGSTYNWESVESGLNPSDTGYTYFISEPDPADALFLFGHNLGTAEASVSVESTDDEVNWTERLAVFTPSDDRAIMKLLTSFRAASKRLKIVTASVAPYIAVAMLGVRMEFPFPPDSPYDPYNIGIESESEVSVEGNHLGDVIYYYPIAQRVVFSNPLRSFITGTYKPFWDAHGRLRKPFAWAWDLTNYPDIVYFMKLSKNARLSMPLSVGTYADSLVLDMEGVAEP